MVYALVLLVRVAGIPSARTSWKFYGALMIAAGMILLWWALFRFT
jgi:hypothetical protein